MTVRILQGDCRDVLKTLGDNSVHMVCTSPPYFGLRDYGTGEWLGGDAACDHKQAHGLQGAGGIRADRTFTAEGLYKAKCLKCGARRLDSQIGLEATPEEFIDEMVQVFREIRRVLRPDGTLWLNLGDSYAAGGNGGHQRSGPPGELSTLEGRKDRKTPSFHGHTDRGIADRAGERRRPPAGLKPKDLIGMPWRVALALQADGWYLRQDIVWAKPNPMPESVTDRCTKSHEYLFLLSKSERYYFDAEAISEPVTSKPNWKTPDGWDTTSGNGGHGSFHKEGREKGHTDYKPKKSGNLERKPSAARGAPEGTGKNQAGSVPWEGTTRNKRSVWTVATAPFAEAHFATFPPALIEPCILAGTSEAGCCALCGAPWCRQAERTLVPTEKAAKTFVIDARDAGADPNDQGSNRQKDGHKPGYAYSVKTTGWARSCSCDPLPPVPAMVLDPFGGAGTTGLVADRAGRDAILIELNSDYADMARRRLIGDSPLFAQVQA